MLKIKCFLLAVFGGAAGLSYADLGDVVRARYVVVAECYNGPNLVQVSWYSEQDDYMIYHNDEEYDFTFQSSSDGYEEVILYGESNDQEAEIEIYWKAVEGAPISPTQSLVIKGHKIECTSGTVAMTWKGFTYREP